MVYQFKAGSHIRADAQVAGEMCERLAAEGRLDAKTLVEENRPEDAPLHGEFEWDNDAAADRWREHQARHIINCLTVKVEEREPIRAFFSIERSDPQYKHIDSIMRSKSETESLLEMALSELRAFERKYAQLEQLAKVFYAIEELVQEQGTMTA